MYGFFVAGTNRPTRKTMNARKELERQAENLSKADYSVKGYKHSEWRLREAVYASYTKARADMSAVDAWRHALSSNGIEPCA